jgi:RNA polymerase sigma-70 factor, ECF subfamily
MVAEQDRFRDSELVAAGLAGDKSALEALVEYYYKPVYRAAYRILNDAEVSADVTQTTFLSAFENLASYDRRYKFFSWLYRIALNTAFDVRRRRELSSERGNEPEEPAAAEPESDIEQEESRRIVRQLINNLQEDYLAVIILRHYSELSYDEMAEVLEIPVKTVRSRLYSARQLLKEQLLLQGYDL